MYDVSGKLTGIMKDNAIDLVAAAVPPMSDEELDRYVAYCKSGPRVADATNSAVDGAIGVLLRNGITSVHHMGLWENVAPLKRARDSGRLKVRVKASLPLASWSEVASMVAKEGAGDSWLRFSGVKGMCL